MSRWRSWSLGAKLVTASVVGLLLTFGLCSVGTKFEQHGTPAQDFAAWAGLLLFAASVMTFFVGILAFLIHVVRDR